MAINYETRYPGKALPASPSYPAGQAKNVTAAGAGDGTPWEASVLNDFLGFLYSITESAGITADNTVDQVGASQFFQALSRILPAKWNSQTTYRVNDLAVGSDGLIYQAKVEQANFDPTLDTGEVNWRKSPFGVRGGDPSEPFKAGDPVAADDVVTKGVYDTSYEGLVVEPSQRLSVPSGTLPSGQLGDLRWNPVFMSFEGYDGTMWGSIGGGAGGGGANSIFYENDTNVTDDYTITTGKNAMSAGPITVDDGVTVTIPNGSTWTVV